MCKFTEFSVTLHKGKEDEIMATLTFVGGKDRVVGFLWQHTLLLVALFFMTIGVALCVRSDLGSSVISSAPLAFTIAGEEGLMPDWSLGFYTNILNWILVAGQIVVLRRRFQAVQLFQLVIGFVFGALIDMSMSVTAAIDYSSLPIRVVAQIVGCSVMALGITMEIRCASITMPGEGLPAAIAKVTGRQFATVKIFVDMALVSIAVVAGYVFFGRWMWNVVGPGTLFAMLYVGMMVKLLGRHIGWFDRMLGYRPGFRRYVYGLARYLASHN